MHPWNGRILILGWVGLLAIQTSISAQVPRNGAAKLRQHYVKEEYRIPMRDGALLFTSVYRPKTATGPLPILMCRTPYSVGPYGVDAYRSDVGPSNDLAASGYIFVYQDVRGRFQSEGTWKPMRPHIARKASPMDVDESSDTHDTITWLLENLTGHNGRVGMWGISYPGFYCVTALVDSHPALVAVSPQAPATDMWIGDDFHHNGAFFLAHAVRWLANNTQITVGSQTARPEPLNLPTPDGYRYFLELGNARDVNRKWAKGRVPIWDDFMSHPDYDAYWKSQNILAHLRDTRPAVLTVGGWFDSEDLYGPLATYRTIEAASPGIRNHLVMGPWLHGGWARSDGDRLGDISFGSKTSAHYRSQVEARFFEHLLKDVGTWTLPEATVFNTGADRWREFASWPPKESTEGFLFLQPEGRLGFDPPKSETTNAEEWDEYVSDPKRPVPFTAEIRNSMGHEFMIEDQRFAWCRPDVLSYESATLTESVTLVGPMMAELAVSTSGTDADFVVKVIDVYPEDAADPNPNPKGVRMSHFQMLVRAEVFRARYRNSYEHPEPLTPDQIAMVRIPLQDVCHTFRPGHRIMVQIQSTWFPLVDRNPQAFVDIYDARPSDYVVARHRIHRSERHLSRVRVRRLP